MTLYPFDLFPAKDGRVSIAVGNPHHWDLLCAAMDRPDLMTDERSASNAARLENVDWVEEQICSWTTKHTRAEIMEKLNGTIPAGPVQNMADIYEDPHVEARGMLEVCEPEEITRILVWQLIQSNLVRRQLVYTNRPLR